MLKAEHSSFGKESLSQVDVLLGRVDASVCRQLEAC